MNSKSKTPQQRLITDWRLKNAILKLEHKVWVKTFESTRSLHKKYHSYKKAVDANNGKQYPIGVRQLWGLFDICSDLAYGDFTKLRHEAQKSPIPTRFDDVFVNMVISDNELLRNDMTVLAKKVEGIESELRSARIELAYLKEKEKENNGKRFFRWSH